MAILDTDPWTAANRRRLEAALATVRAALERRVASLSETAIEGDAPVPEPAAPSDGDAVLGERPATVDQVAAAFGLSSFERDVLVLCAGVELDTGIAELCAAANGDPGRDHATFGLALAALPDAHWSALTPDAPLRRWRLVEPGTGALVTAPLRIDERVLHHLVGLEAVDERLAGYLEPLSARPGDLDAVPSLEDVAHHLARRWLERSAGTRSPVIELCGTDRASKRLVADLVAAHVGLRIASLRAEALPTDPREVEALLRLCEREAALSQAAICLDADGLEGPDAAREATVSQAVESLAAPLLLLARDRRPTRSRPVISVHVRKPTAAEQGALWKALVGPDRLDGGAAQLASQFDLGIRGIREATVEALDGAGADATEAELLASLWNACRAQARPRMDDLAQRVEARAGWSDLVLPPGQLQTLRELAMQVRHRATVYEEWGFGATSSRGLGIAALFVGSSGTGKTLAAEVIANELRLDLYRIDLSQVVSKYIGETEKNLRRVFDAAEDGGAILLFDEADALFGKRSEVKDSHDRYANIEVGYLLQRMEAYRGLAVLTTNLKESIDSAFLRRIRFTVHFPFPDSAARAEIWRRVVPAAAPTDHVDAERLSRLNVAGGNIRNIALNAAFLAADQGAPIRMEHLLQATRTEYAKLERTLTEPEVAGWT
jgi:ATPase family associated with various cellular activities (AAA)/Winged helix domain, variant